MCMRQTYAPASAMTPASSGIAPQGGDVVDEHRAQLERPAARPPPSRCRSRRAAPASRSSTGTTRRSSSSTRDRLGSRAGRLTTDVDERRAFVEQPPGRRDRDVAGRGSRPPSEKLSGVTLTTPITEGRGQHSASGGRLTRRWSVPAVSRQRDDARAARPRCAAAPARSRSRSHRPAPSRRARRARAGRRTGSSTSLISLYLLLMVVGVGLWVVHPPDPQGRGRRWRIATRTRRSPWVTFVILALGFGAARPLRPLALGRRGPAPAHSRLGSHRANRRRASGDARQGRATLPAPVRDRAPCSSSSRSSRSRSWRGTSRYRARRRKLEPLPESLLPGARRRARRDPRRPPRRDRPAPRGDRRLRAHGAGARGLRASAQPGRGARRVPAAHLRRPRGEPAAPPRA